LGNIEPEDRKVPISIGLSTKSWKRIDKFMHENGGMNRSQFFETITKWYMDERENPDGKPSFTARQINNYFEDLERYLRLSDMEEVRKLLPIIRHTNQLAQNLTRKVKRDISKITDLDPTEKIRLENTRKAHEYRDMHEGAAIESELVALKLKPEPPELEPKLELKANTNIETSEIELRRLAEVTGNEISEQFKTRQQKEKENEERQKPDIDIEIIQDEVPNPYGKGEMVFQ
jgi:hypothetical protein